MKDIATHTQNAISTVGMWKQGRLPSSSETIARLAEIFQVSVSFLRDGQARPDESPRPDRTARILEDIDTLLAELHPAAGHQDYQAAEPPAERGESSPLERPGSREEMETYFQDFLKEAERHPDGLAYAWYQLRREFPHNLYGQLRRRT